MTFFNTAFRQDIFYSHRAVFFLMFSFSLSQWFISVLFYGHCFYLLYIYLNYWTLWIIDIVMSIESLHLFGFNLNVIFLIRNMRRILKMLNLIQSISVLLSSASSISGFVKCIISFHSRRFRSLQFYNKIFKIFMMYLAYTFDFCHRNNVYLCDIWLKMYSNFQKRNRFQSCRL